jgi:hypothetical protein
MQVLSASGRPRAEVLDRTGSCRTSAWIRSRSLPVLVDNKYGRRRVWDSWAEDPSVQLAGTLGQSVSGRWSEDDGKFDT